MRTCKHCYKTFDLAHECGAAGRMVYSSDEADVTLVVPSDPTTLIGGIPQNIDDGDAQI